MTDYILNSHTVQLVTYLIIKDILTYIHLRYKLRLQLYMKKNN